MRVDSHSAISDELSPCLENRPDLTNNRDYVALRCAHTHQLITSFHVLYAQL